MKFSEREKYIGLLKKEVIPALGCTEPIAVALAAARAKQLLGKMPEKVVVKVSSNIFKNGMGVGIPGTGMVGLKIAAALGIVCGVPEKKLEVLGDVNGEHVGEAKEFMENSEIEIGVKDKCEKLYIECDAISGNDVSKVIIKECHTNIVHESFNGVIVKFKETDEPEAVKSNDDGIDIELNIENIFEFGTTEPIDNLSFILEGAVMNKRISDEGLKNTYGLQVGKKIMENIDRGFLCNDIMTHAMAVTAAASDARMAGCTLPAMSNSGSGNQGITVFLPIIAVADKMGINEEKLTRALIIGNLVAIHIKKYLGRLSALCGCVVASAGASSGIVYMLGGGSMEIGFAIKNMIANITGMICDGAKTGCGLKVSTGVSSAVQSALLAIDGIVVSCHEGIIDNCVEKTIKNLALIGSQAMNETDTCILNIMTCK